MKPNKRRPQMYYQKADEGDSLITGDRIRILYPNGDVESAILVHKGRHDWFFKDHPCWAYKYDMEASKREFIKFKNMQLAKRAMNKFDKNMGWGKAVFVANL